MLLRYDAVCHRGRNINSNCRERRCFYFIPKILLSSFNFKIVIFDLVFAMTINKAQRISLKMGGVNFESSCLFHGLLYVTWSGVGSPEKLFLRTSEG